MHHSLSRTANLAVCLVATAGWLAGSGFASAHDLPLGDGKYGSKARKGYVFSCQTRFNSNQGAQAYGDWLNKAAGTWDPEKKPMVDGAVNWPSEISFTVEGNKRVIRGNGLPWHPTGTYPVSGSDDAYKFDRNPNTGNRFGKDAEMKIANQRIYHDADHPSHIVLPVVPNS